MTEAALLTLGLAAGFALGALTVTAATIGIVALARRLAEADAASGQAAEVVALAERYTREAAK